MLPSEEAVEFIHALKGGLPKNLDGRETVLALQAAGFNWRQMEWIGFGFEHLAGAVLRHRCGAESGPRFGRTQFDIRREYVWDLKAHPSGAAGPVLNDREAIERCIADFGGVGFIIADGVATYDEQGEFKVWHDTLKGGISAYELTRVERGAPSRRRKTAFSISRYEAFWFPSSETLQAATAAGHLGYFQEGMRNSNGLPRRAKYQIRNLAGLRRSEALVATSDL